MVEGGLYILEVAGLQPRNFLKMGEASRLSKKGKSLTARYFSFGFGHSWLSGVETCDFCFFDVSFFFALFFFITFQSLTPHAWVFLDLSIVLLCFFNWDWGAEDFAFMYVWEQFCLPGAKKKQEFFFLYDTGIRRLWSFYNLLFIPFGKIWKDAVFMPGDGRNREARACLGQAYGVWIAARASAQRPGCDAMHSPPRGERDRLLAMQAGEAVCIKHAAPEPCAVNH